MLENYNYSILDTRTGKVLKQIDTPEEAKEILEKNKYLLVVQYYGFIGKSKLLVKGSGTRFLITQ
jgi:hypothetical protein